MTIYAYIVFTICALDLGATIFGIQEGWMTEGNPYLLEAYERGGIATMAATKIAITTGAVAFLEGAYEVRDIARPAIEAGYRILIGVQIAVLVPAHSIVFFV